MIGGGGLDDPEGAPLPTAGLEPKEEAPRSRAIEPSGAGMHLADRNLFGADVAEDPCGSQQPAGQVPPATAWPRGAPEGELQWAIAAAGAPHEPRPPPPKQPGWSKAALIDEQASICLGARAADWYTALEHYYVRWCSLSPLQAAKVRGRAEGVNIAWQRAPNTAGRGIRWRESRAAWWSKVAAILREFWVLRQRGRGQQQQQRCQRNLGSLAAAPPDGFDDIRLANQEWVAMVCDEMREGFAFSGVRFRHLLGQAATLPAPALKRLSDTADKAENIWVARAAAEAAQGFAQWVAQHSAKAGPLFYWSRREDRNREDKCVEQGRAPDPRPHIFMEQKRQHWATLWKEAGTTKPDEDSGRALDIEALTLEVRRLRTEHGDSYMEACPEDLDKALNSMKATTATGCEAMGPRDLLDLPRAGKWALLALWRQCEQAWMWPWQCLLNLVTLVPKPTTGDRGIGSIPVVLRAWCKMRGNTPDQWCDEEAAFWDKAVRGSSALQVALHRCMEDELARQLETTATGGLIDIEGFYHHIELHLLLREAERWRYPVQQLALGRHVDAGGSDTTQALGHSRPQT